MPLWEAMYSRTIVNEVIRKSVFLLVAEIAQCTSVQVSVQRLFLVGSGGQEVYSVIYTVINVQ